MPSPLRAVPMNDRWSPRGLRVQERIETVLDPRCPVVAFLGPRGLRVQERIETPGAPPPLHGGRRVPGGCAFRSALKQGTVAVGAGVRRVGPRGLRVQERIETTLNAAKSRAMTTSPRGLRVQERIETAR